MKVTPIIPDKEMKAAGIPRHTHPLMLGLQELGGRTARLRQGGPFTRQRPRWRRWSHANPWGAGEEERARAPVGSGPLEQHLLRPQSPGTAGGPWAAVSRALWWKHAQGPYWEGLEGSGGGPGGRPTGPPMLFPSTPRPEEAGTIARRHRP